MAKRKHVIRKMFLIKILSNPECLTWKFSFCIWTITPTVCGSICTISPNWNWPKLSTPVAISVHSWRSWKNVKKKALNRVCFPQKLQSQVHIRNKQQVYFTLGRVLSSCMVRSEKRTTMFSSTLTIRPVSPSYLPPITRTWSPLKENEWLWNQA